MIKNSVKYISITKKEVVLMEEKVKISMLCQLYGKLLTEKQYNFYRQPCNSGLPVTLSLVNAQLMLNGKELNAYNAAASRAQIKSILDSGQAGDQPTFRCYVDNYNALDENDSKITDPKVLKYTNKTSEITLPLEENSDFESNFKNGIPSYSVTTDAQTGKTVYTRLTDENYEAEMAKASTEDSNVKIVQETRDKNELQRLL